MNAYVKTLTGVATKPPVLQAFPVITPKEAVAQGTSASTLMTIANSLERLAKGYVTQAESLDSSSFANREERRALRAQADENIRNAGQLRRVARAVRNIQSKGE